mgnify:CR=1 FL=1
MMNTNIIQLFSIPLFVTTIPNSLATVIPYFDSQEMDVDNPNKEGVQNFGNKSKNTYILEEPECKDLKHFLLDNIQNYSHEILGTLKLEYKFNQSWISHKHPNQHHLEHTHPNSYISGVLFFGDKEDSTSSINFHSPLRNSNYQFYVAKDPDQSINSKYNYDTYSYNYNPGDLLLFPSWLCHSVPLNTTSQIRKSLAFNSIPAKGLGDVVDLTELKF